MGLQDSIQGFLHTCLPRSPEDMRYMGSYPPVFLPVLLMAYADLQGSDGRMQPGRSVLLLPLIQQTVALYNVRL